MSATRELAKWAMESAGLARVMAPDLTASLRPGPARLEVVDETSPANLL
jgi:hypothetical protein